MDQGCGPEGSFVENLTSTFAPPDPPFGCEAPRPYPNILQHRECRAKFQQSAMEAMKNSDIARLVVPDPDTPMMVVGLPPPLSTSAGAGDPGATCASAAAFHSNAPTGLNSDALNEEEREHLLKIVINRTEMAKVREKVQRQATEVVVAGGIALAEPYGPARIDIFHAACDGDPKSLYLNMLHGANINALGTPNPKRYMGVQLEKRWTFYGTPLMFAASFGRERAVRALLAWGADPLIKSSTGLIAKDYAAKREYHAIVHMLEEAAERASPKKVVFIRPGKDIDVGVGRK